MGTLCFNQTGYAAPENASGRRKHEKRPRGKWITVAIPPIVELELFERAQIKHIIPIGHIIDLSLAGIGLLDKRGNNKDIP